MEEINKTGKTKINPSHLNNVKMVKCLCNQGKLNSITMTMAMPQPGVRNLKSTTGLLRRQSFTQKPHKIQCISLVLIFSAA